MNDILQVVIAKNLENIMFLVLGLVITPLAVLTGTNLALTIHKMKVRRKARKFLRTARPENVDNSAPWWLR